MRFRPDGVLEYLGRVDRQIKVRGFRVEPGEIESALLGITGVREAVVRAREDVPGQARLVAYLAPDSSRPPSVSELRRLLKETLPAHMVPSSFVLLDTLPKTPSGKLDPAALPAPESARPEGGNPYRGPHTPAEEVLTEIWMKVLGVDQVGVDDNFFELGGHSLLATQVISRIRDAFHVELPLRDLFLNPTVAGLALAIGRRQTERIAPERFVLERRLEEKAGGVSEGLISRRVGEGAVGLSFGQERLWLLDRLDPGKAVYNIPRAFRIRGRLDVEALGRALETIQERHEVLRSAFPAVDGNPVQVVGPARAPSLPVVDLGAFAQADRDGEALRVAEEEAGRPFDLEVGPMLRATLLRLAEEEHVLLVNIHHIVFDGWSTAIFDDELSTLYAAYVEGRPSPLASLSIQYADFAVWQREWLRGGVLEEQLSYWKGQLEGAPAVLELPTSRARSPVQSFRGATETVSISQSVADGIRGLGQRRGGDAVHDAACGLPGSAAALLGARRRRGGVSRGGASSQRDRRVDWLFRQHARLAHGSIG